MNLIIDTTTEKLVLILTNNNKVYKSKENNLKHLKHLLPEIERLLDSASCKLEDILTFSVVIGPGSFTGARIGVSTIKAFSCVLTNKKYVTINALELLAFSLIKKNIVKTNFAVAIKSTSTKYYFGLCNTNGNVSNMQLLTVTELKNYIEKEKIPLFTLNTDIETLSAKKITLEEDDYIAYSNYKITQKMFTEPNDIKPLYLALSQAEEELNKRKNGCK